MKLNSAFRNSDTPKLKVKTAFLLFANARSSAEKKKLKKNTTEKQSWADDVTAEPREDWLAKHRQAAGRRCCWTDRLHSQGSYLDHH